MLETICKEAIKNRHDIDILAMNDKYMFKAKNELAYSLLSQEDFDSMNGEQYILLLSLLAKAIMKKEANLLKQ